jgi:hypothetical protein
MVDGWSCYPIHQLLINHVGITFMAVSEHVIGGHRAYKQINCVVHQFYSHNKEVAERIQEDLESKARIYKALKSNRLFSKCGRLAYLRIRKYKKTNEATFQLQIFEDGKQKKTQCKLKSSFEVSWVKFLKLWRESMGFSVIDIQEHKEEIIKAKRLYMQDVYRLENTKNI